MSENYLLKMYRKASAFPGGRHALSLFVARKAPYFATVRPVLAELRENYAEVHIKKRRSVENHIGTVHVIAICNALEMAMGTLAEASIPAQLRWIPKGMDVKYLAKADSDIRAIAEVAADAWHNGPDVPVKVRALRDDGTVVVEGVISLWVTEKAKR